MVDLEFCRRTDPRYVAMRDRHYVPNRGSHGQQLHFLIHHDGAHVGIISGGSPAWRQPGRDKFFGINGNAEERGSLYLPAIVDNTVFRIEDTAPNLGTRVLALWRRTVAQLWQELYGVPVIGFETFIVPTPTRTGSMYLADNWTYVGMTSGMTKSHGRSDMPDAQRKKEGSGGLGSGTAYVPVDPKLVYCRWSKKLVVPTTPYVSSWNKRTPEERQLDRDRTKRRRELEGTRFSAPGMAKATV